MRCSAAAGHNNLWMILRHLRVLYCARVNLIAMVDTLARQIGKTTARLNRSAEQRTALGQG